MAAEMSALMLTRVYMSYMYTFGAVNRRQIRECGSGSVIVVIILVYFMHHNIRHRSFAHIPVCRLIRNILACSTKFPYCK